MLHILSVVDIGERAGSGYDVLCEGTMSAGKPDPTYEEIYEPERVKLTMELETSGLAEFRLPGMGGESSPLVTKVEPPSRNVGNDGNDVGNVGNVGGYGMDTPIEDRIVSLMRRRPRISAGAIAEELGISKRHVERLTKTLRESGRIAREGGTRNLYKFSRLYSGADPVLVEGDCFETFVPVPDAMDGRRPGAADATARPKDRRAEVRDAVARLLARHGSFPASQLADEVTSVGERTVRRYLAKMVEDGELKVVAGGRSTRYAASNGGDD